MGLGKIEEHGFIGKQKMVLAKAGICFMVLEMIHVTNHVKNGTSGYAVVIVIYSTQIAITS